MIIGTKYRILANLDTRLEDKEMMNKKSIALSISVLLTIFIFTMSLLPGTDSGNLSSGMSASLKNVWDQIFINHPITLEDMGRVVRKTAHVFEYGLLGISYFFTAKYWRLSILKAITIGFMTAGLDEIIQLFVPGRAGRWIDVLLFDLGGFILGLGLMLLIFNRKKKPVITYEVLEKVKDNDISLKKAYKMIYQNQDAHLNLTDRAHFIRLKIIIPDEAKVTKFLGYLTYIPFPLFIVRFVLLFMKSQLSDQFTKEDIMEIIQSKGAEIEVKASSGEIIQIKLF